MCKSFVIQDSAASFLNGMNEGTAKQEEHEYRCAAFFHFPLPRRKRHRADVTREFLVLEVGKTLHGIAPVVVHLR
jgi:hypothetical protein